MLLAHVSSTSGGSAALLSGARAIARVLRRVCLPEVAEEVAVALAKVPGVLRLPSGGLGEGARIVDRHD